MSKKTKSCHGHTDCLRNSSTGGSLSPVFQGPRRVWIYLAWYLKNKGLWGTFNFVLFKIAKRFAPPNRNQRTLSKRNNLSLEEEVLNLRPGELVEVKSEKEILATLDQNRAHKGLLWMMGMDKYCGKSCRVYKRVRTIYDYQNSLIRPYWWSSRPNIF